MDVGPDRSRGTFGVISGLLGASTELAALVKFLEQSTAPTSFPDNALGVGGLATALRLRADVILHYNTSAH